MEGGTVQTGRTVDRTFTLEATFVAIDYSRPVWEGYPGIAYISGDWWYAITAGLPVVHTGIIYTIEVTVYKKGSPERAITTTDPIVSMAR